MFKIRKSLYFFSIFLFIFSFLFVHKTLAQGNGIGVKISPTKIEDIVEPGKTYKYELKVTNESPSAVTFYAYLKDFKAGGEEGLPILIAPGSEKGYFLASWIDIVKDGVDFAPHEEKIIPFYVNIPEETGPGGYYGGVYWGTKPPRLDLNSEDKGAGMSVAQQTGSLVLLQIKGDAIENAIIREFNTDKDVYPTPFDVDFLIRIENKGNVHVKPLGQISVSNMFGKEVSVVRVNTKGGNVLPNSIRRFNEHWKDDFGFGRYKASIGLSYGTAVDMGGQGKQSLYTEKYFWIIPWKIVNPIIIGFVFFTALFILLLRLYRNKAIKKAMQRAGLGHIKYVKQYDGPSPTLHFAMILLIVLGIIFVLMFILYFMFLA